MVEAVARIIGGYYRDFCAISKIAGRSVGIVSFVLDGRDVWVTFSEHGFDWNELSTWDQVKVGAVALGGVALAFEFFWLGAAASTVTMGIAVLKH